MSLSTITIENIRRSRLLEAMTTAWCVNDSWLNGWMLLSAARVVSYGSYSIYDWYQIS